MNQPNRIQPQQLQQLQHAQTPLWLIDVRSPAEYRQGHVAGALLYPLDQWQAPQLLEQLRSQGWDEQQPLYLICQAGQRAVKAAGKLGQTSTTLVIVEGGTQACIDSGFTLEREAGHGNTLSLQRQVLITAGSLILLGLALYAWVTPLGLLLSGFVGAGLVFAGVSNTCGLALLLARMPWNR